MPRGGKRAGAGRKKGSVTKLTREITEKVLKRGITPLEYMMSVLRNRKTTKERRDQMAIAAAPYIHPRLQAIEHNGNQAGLVIQIVKFAGAALPGPDARTIDVQNVALPVAADDPVTK